MGFGAQAGGGGAAWLGIPYDRTASRDLETIYQNTDSTYRLISFRAQITDLAAGDGEYCNAFIGATSPPSTQISQAGLRRQNNVGWFILVFTLNFVVPPGYYYKIHDYTGNGNIMQITWIEHDAS